MEALVCEARAGVTADAAGVHEGLGALELRGGHGGVVAAEEAVPRAVCSLEGGELEGADGVCRVGEGELVGAHSVVGGVEEVDVGGHRFDAGHEVSPHAGEVVVGAVSDLVVAHLAAHLVAGGDREHRLEPGQTRALVEHPLHLVGELDAGGGVVLAGPTVVDAAVPEQVVHDVQVEHRRRAPGDAVAVRVGAVGAQSFAAHADGQGPVVCGAGLGQVAGHAGRVVVVAQQRIEGEHPAQLHQLVGELGCGGHRLHAL